MDELNEAGRSDDAAPRSCWGWGLRSCALLAAAYVMLGALAMLFEERLIYFPTRGGRVSGAGEDIQLRARDGVALHARFVARAGARHTLLYMHGNAGNLASRGALLDTLAGLGANLLALEYRGYGASQGEPSEAGIYLDARAAYDWAAAHGGGPAIVPLGESLGGGPACELAATREVAGLILLSAFSSVPDMAALSFPWLPARRLVRTQFDNLSKIRRVRAPVLIVHSRADEIVPFEMGARLFDAASEPKRALWLDQAGHNETFFREGPRVSGEITTFLEAL